MTEQEKRNLSQSTQSAGVSTDEGVKVVRTKQQDTSKQASVETVVTSKESSEKVKEINGPKGLEPTRYGDWESKGRCYDF